MSCASGTAFAAIPVDVAASESKVYDFMSLESLSKFIFYFLLIVTTSKLLKSSKTPTTLASNYCVKKQPQSMDLDQANLFQGVAGGDIEVCAKLLQGGVNVNTVDVWGCTALHIAARIGSIEMVQWLLAREVVVDAPDVSFETPLHLAARGGHVAICDALVAHGASVHSTHPEQQSPLLVAAVAGRKDVCNLLQSRGASVDVMDDVPLKAQALLLEHGSFIAEE